MGSCFSRPTEGDANNNEFPSSVSSVPSAVSVEKRSNNNIAPVAASQSVHISSGVAPQEESDLSTTYTTDSPINGISRFPSWDPTTVSLVPPHNSSRNTLSVISEGDSADDADISSFSGLSSLSLQSR